MKKILTELAAAMALALMIGLATIAALDACAEQAEINRAGAVAHLEGK